ncbi:MAG TPA: hypothetical protein VJ821_04505 [Anaerolineales bacterium]|nr:hypothetical protein [Anaerolineales bacterium]
MARKIYPTDLLEQALSVQDAWGRIDDQLAFGNLNVAALVTDINAAKQAEVNVISLENQLDEMRTRRDSLYQSTWDKVKRIRAAVKGIYGDDSPQYDAVGGTRLSERKSPRRTVSSN